MADITTFNLAGKTAVQLGFIVDIFSPLWHKQKAMSLRKINNALISVFDKTGLADVALALHDRGVTLISTGGTLEFIEGLGLPVQSVESHTGYASLLGGRVKTLHPKVFGGILARREEAIDLAQVGDYEFALIDLVIVDLYPFEKTVNSTVHEAVIIEKIDIGGIALIRAAAKNFNDVCIISHTAQYPELLAHLKNNGPKTDTALRAKWAREAFATTSHYDTAIYNWFARGEEAPHLKISAHLSTALRYGENPHQKARYYGRLDDLFTQLNGKELSYNNLVDLDAAMRLAAEFSDPTTVIIKHTNSCGLASDADLLMSWKKALACDPISAFGGVIGINRIIDGSLAREINRLFFEILIAPGYEVEALSVLKGKKNRILLTQIKPLSCLPQIKSLLEGYIWQEADAQSENEGHLQVVTKEIPPEDIIPDLVFAAKAAKHLKSNGIALVKNRQLIGMGCGQTSRIDALRQAITKARAFGFDLCGSVMASDAFFPFPDCVEESSLVGIAAIIQPGGSVKDQDSIEAADKHKIAMCFTGFRHFRH